MKKRPKRKAAKPPPARRAPRLTPPPAPAPLQYKVVELSAVDESSLERTVNQWCAQGWTLENVQFAMRESSKRPAMAFVFFVREGGVGAESARPESEALGHLRRLAEVPAELEGAVRPMSAYDRLAQLAEGGDEE